MLTEQETIGKGCPGGEQEGKGTPENCSAMWFSLGFYSDGISFQVVSDSHSGSVLPGGAHIDQPRRMPARILGGRRTRGISF